MQLSQDFFIRLVAIFGLFLGVSLAIFWVGIVWWVSQDVLARSKDKIIVAASVAIAAILGPVGVLLYLIIRPKQTIQEANIEIMEREMLLHASATTICPTCNRMAQQDFLACPYCGTQLKYHCPVCKKLVELDWEHCPYCGTDLTHDHTQLPPQPPAPLPAQQPDQFIPLDSPQPEAAYEQPLPRSRPRRRKDPVIKAILTQIGSWFAQAGHLFAGAIRNLIHGLNRAGEKAGTKARVSGRKIAVATTQAVSVAQSTVKSRVEQYQAPASRTSPPSQTTPTPNPSATNTIQFASPRQSLSATKSTEKTEHKTKKDDINKVINEVKHKKANRHRA